MPRLVCFFALFVIAACAVLPQGSAAQSESTTPFSAAAVGIKMSLLGAGFEVATPVTRRANLRGGFNAFSYDHSFDRDGVNYAGQLSFRSAELHYDWFPFAGRFHLSPGALIYNGNQVTANGAVTAGKTFTLNDTTYISDPANPVTGTGNGEFLKAGPMLTVGWGNLLSHRHRHFSVPFEFGAIYTGSPRISLNMAGSACDSSGMNCQLIASDPSIQSNVQAEKNKIQKDIAAFRFYPVLSLGFGMKF
jgi:hypothetical protein